jgi:hypothetical protein
MPEPAQVPTPVEIGFSPIFWNTAWTINQPPHTLGLLIDEAHPALAGFPTAFHSDWQWQPILRHAAALVIDELPRELPVIVRPIDDWHQCRRLGLIFEARCNGGRVLVCAADLRPELDQRPGARCLWDALLRYMDTPGFDPQVEVTPQALKRICGRSR